MAGWEGAHPDHPQALCFLCSILVCLFLSPFIACLCPSAASQLYAHSAGSGLQQTLLT